MKFGGGKLRNSRQMDSEHLIDGASLLVQFHGQWQRRKLMAAYSVQDSLSKADSEHYEVREASAPSSLLGDLADGAAKFNRHRGMPHCADPSQ
jgi:hypothetical protein